MNINQLAPPCSFSHRSGLNTSSWRMCGTSYNRRAGVRVPLAWLVLLRIHPFWPEMVVLDTQADEVLGELSTLFRGFGKLPPGSVGRRTLDPTGLRLALANLDPKRFAAGRAKQRCPPPPCQGHFMCLSYASGRYQPSCQELSALCWQACSWSASDTHTHTAQPQRRLSESVQVLTHGWRRVCAAGEMSDAAEVLNVVTERLDLAEEGRAMAQAVLGCHIREQMHCLRCGRDTRQKSYCQYLFTASASGLREQASVMRHGDEGDRGPVAVRPLHQQPEGAPRLREPSSLLPCTHGS